MKRNPARTAGPGEGKQGAIQLQLQGRRYRVVRRKIQTAIDERMDLPTTFEQSEVQNWDRDRSNGDC